MRSLCGSRARPVDSRRRPGGDPGALTGDADSYRQLAENLVAHGTFGTDHTPTAYRPPLYPLLLVGCVALGDYAALPSAYCTSCSAWPRWLWCGAGATAGLSGHGLGSQLAAGKQDDPGRSCWLPAAVSKTRTSAPACCPIVAMDPILLTQSALVMTETLAAFLTTAGLAASLGPAAGRQPIGPCWPGPRWASACSAGPRCCSGRCWPLAVLSFRAIAAGLRLRVIPLAFLPRLLLIVLSPWAIRNQLQFGRPIVTTTHGGYTLLLANNPEFYEWLGSGRWGSVWRADRLTPPGTTASPTTSCRPIAWHTGKRGRPSAGRRGCFATPAGASGPFLFAATAPGAGQRNAAAPPIAIPRGPLVRDRVLVGGGRRLAQGTEERGEGRGNRCDRFSPFRLPPSAFPLALGPAAGRVPVGCSGGLLDRHADAWPGDAGRGVGCRPGSDGPAAAPCRRQLSFRLVMTRWDGSCTPLPLAKSGAAVQLPPQRLHGNRRQIGARQINAMFEHSCYGGASSDCWISANACLARSRSACFTMTRTSPGASARKPAV